MQILKKIGWPLLTMVLAWMVAGECLAQGRHSDFDPGRVWRVREGDFKATWTRRGNSDTFDAVWVNTRTGRQEQDVLRFEGVRENRVVLYREGLRGRYYGYLSGDGRRIENGTADWYKGRGSWSAVIEQGGRDRGRPEPDFDPGRVWRVREGDFDAIWNRRGRSNDFEAEWVHRRTGERIRDTVTFEAVRGNQVILYRHGTRGRYTGTLSRDGQRIENGTADWYTRGGYWSARIER